MFHAPWAKVGKKNTMANNLGDGNKNDVDNQSQLPIPFENTFGNVAYQVFWSSQPFQADI